MCTLINSLCFANSVVLQIHLACHICASSLAFMVYWRLGVLPLGEVPGIFILCVALFQLYFPVDDWLRRLDDLFECKQGVLRLLESASRANSYYSHQ